jgi:hypothetical protein
MDNEPIEFLDNEQNVRLRLIPSAAAQFETTNTATQTSTQTGTATGVRSFGLYLLEV